MLNIGDVVFQVIMLLVIVGGITAMILVVRSVVKNHANSKSVEQKLDKVIELLKKEKHK